MSSSDDNSSRTKSPLTLREVEVMTWAARGKTYGEIGILLSIRADTAKAHIENVRNKLTALNKAHAIAIAISSGFVKL